MRPDGDVSALPTVVFGPRSLMWWGTLGFMTIEGWSIALLLAVYFYVRQNFTDFPPSRTPFPSLLMPTINVAVMLLSFVPAIIVKKAAERLETARVKLWLIPFSVLAFATLVLRWWDLWSLNVRWDTNAYGSAAWVLVGFHATLLLLDVGDTIGLTAFFWGKPLPPKALSDAADNSFYWFFTVGIWIVLYLILYVGPRVF